MNRPDAPIVSEVTLYQLQPSPDGRRAPGSPVATLTTYAGGRATMTAWADDGSVFPETTEGPLPAKLVLDAIKGMRRSAQDEPNRFVCLNRTRRPGQPDTLTLVA